MAKSKLTAKGNVQLTLKPAEALILRRLLGHHTVGDGPRNILDRVWSALRQFDGTVWQDFEIGPLNISQTFPDRLFITDDLPIDQREAA